MIWELHVPLKQLRFVILYSLLIRSIEYPIKEQLLLFPSKISCLGLPNALEDLFDLRNFLSYA